MEMCGWDHHHTFPWLHAPMAQGLQIKVGHDSCRVKLYQEMILHNNIVFSIFGCYVPIILSCPTLSEDKLHRPPPPRGGLKNQGRLWLAYTKLKTSGRVLHATTLIC